MLVDLRRVSPRFTVAAASIVAAGLLGTAVVAGIWSTERVDTLSVARQAHFASVGLEAAYRKIPVDQESVTIWDDTVTAARERDVDWLDHNVGTWMASYFGHSAAYVLDGRGHPFYAMEGGAKVAPETYLPHATMVTPLLSRLMADIERASAPGNGSLGAEDILDWDGNPAIVSVKPIVPDPKAFQQEPDDRYFHVAVRKIDASLLRDIASDYMLTDLRLVEIASTTPAVGVPIRGSSGTLLGYLTWEPYRPGADFFSRIGITLAVLAAMGVALLALLLRSVWRATSELEVSEAQARYLASHDTLTGLPNRAMFDRSIEQRRAARHERSLSFGILLLDIDHFKRVNDTQGHPAGDELVRGIADRLRHIVASGDLVARIGGDEFGLVIVDHPGAPGRCVQVAEGIGALMREPLNLLGEPSIVTISIGVATSGEPGFDKDELIRRADIALYDAKSKGGGQYQVFAEAMDEVVRFRRRIERDLIAALRRGEGLWVAYQPIFAGNGRTVLGAEALVRWRHPSLGDLPPEMFVGVAEERGLVGQLGDYVLDAVCEFLAAADFPWVAVNISALQFHRADFVDQILARLARYRLDAARLQLEITESTLIDNRRQVERSLERLRDAGITITLDDFGTGFSSMNYLRQYPIDKIKIDRSFVAQLGTTAESDAIVRAIIAMARAMRKEVVGEGVETEAQRDHLAALGCHQLQGFLLSQPVTAATLLSQRLSAMATAMASTDQSNIASPTRLRR
jgi:diguanylate cyclase (GGDEF)-like protein